MKRFLRNCVVRYLAYCAKRKLKIWHPIVVAVTGSVGKTTTKDIIASVLSTHFQVRKTEGNYNTDIGLPLSILNISVGASLLSWFGIIWRAWKAGFQADTASHYIIEMGADKPGDIRYLTSLIKPDVSIVTNIAKVHLEVGQFQDERAIQQEKSEIIRILTSNDLAILNNDNPHTREMKQQTVARTLLYGTTLESDLRVNSLRYTDDGIAFTVDYNNDRYHFTSSVLGDFFIYAFLPAIAVGLEFKIPIESIQEVITSFKPPKGRFNKIQGVKGSIIIDSSYNSSPYAAREAITSFSSVQGKRKIIVLGTMNELGAYSSEEHRSIGQYVATRCDMLITVGEDARIIAETAKKIVPQLVVTVCQNYQEASIYLSSIIQEGDLILCKGSQNNVFLEEVVKSIMQDPSQASTLLVRQGREWERKKIIL